MPADNYQLFVYGSLRSGFHHPAYAYISHHFILAGDARVKGRLYDMGEYPAAVPAVGEYYIIGELYRIKHEPGFARAMEEIDDYEGVHPQQGAPPLYRREITTVYIGGQTTTAWIYWYNREVTGRPLIASGDVLAYRSHHKQ